MSLPLFIYQTDHAISLWFHEHLTHTSSGALMLMSDVAAPWTVGGLTAVTAAVLAWRRVWHHLLALALAVPGGMVVNELLKVSIHRARPFATSEYIDVTGYSFPSAHTMAATLIYGVLAVVLVSIFRERHHRFAATVCAVMLVIVVAFSRVALGAHYLTDVLGAIAASVAWLRMSFGAAAKFVPRPVRVREDAEEI